MIEDNHVSDANAPIAPGVGTGIDIDADQFDTVTGNMISGN